MWWEGNAAILTPCSSIYGFTKADPDVKAIVHTHPPFASALSMTGKALAVAHMDASVFYEDCGHLQVWPGVPIADEEGRLISEALGDKRAVLLDNHGFLTVGATLEEAVYLGRAI